jgi:hypothetical protein
MGGEKDSKKKVAMYFYDPMTEDGKRCTESPLPSLRRRIFQGPTPTRRPLFLC